MKIYTYSEARQNLALLLKEVQKEGSVEIGRRDGSTFILKP
jgi:prevent-host-death family protein